jgi:signal transduction histidine kinase
MDPSKASTNLFVWTRLQSWVSAFLWTACIVISLLWNLHEQGINLVLLATNTAEVTFDNDVLYRRWVARQGGVYVRVTEHVHPNPYLQLPDRDVATRSGLALTLINPAYLARMVNEMAPESAGSRGHITSLKPIRPENGPDVWEVAALQAFEKGKRQVSSVQWVNGDEYLRIMRPFMVEESCLQCHAAQGYKVGDVRGGISVAVAMAPLRAVARPQASKLAMAHFGLWLIGLAGLALAHRALRKHLSAREMAEDTLRQARDTLELRVEERTAELSRVVETLHAEVDQRARAEEALLDHSRQLRRLASELALAEQRERQRLAQVLHDGLQQTLVALKLRLALSRNEAETRQNAAEITDLVNDAIGISRSLTGELTPPILRHGGLVPALEWLAHTMQDKHGLTVDLVANGPVGPAPAEVHGLMFQATRELLFNVVKHAGVPAARVEVTQRDGQIQIDVSDRGNGFDSGRTVQPFNGADGFGLFNIRERLQLLGGRLEIESALGQGSRIRLSAPCSMP